MSKNKLTLAEKIALLIVIRKELETIFSETEITLTEFRSEAKAVIDNLSSILQQGFKIDPEDNAYYNMFDK